MSAVPVYPVRVEGKLDPHLSRWLWLVKWLLAIPHYLVLVLLWVAFAVLSVVALVAILATGRYPRSLFDFNVGVLRWTWRVAFYTYSALGTDRYPPFTLAEARDYPATLEVPYPERLSRGLALVKWWLLAFPHYLVLAVFVGGGAYVAWQTETWRWSWGGGLVGLLVLIAAVALLVTGRYPRGIFDFVLGMNRWALRVAAYAGLMTDAYPPFRLDLGGDEPGSVEVGAATEPSAATAKGRWTGGRVALVVLGGITALVALAFLAAGVAGVVVDRTQRDEAGFLMSPTEDFSTPTYALVSETIDVSVEGPDWLAGSFLGDVKIRSESTAPVFVGIASDEDAASYLDGVRRAVVTDLGPDRERYTVETGAAPAAPPGEQGFWVASSAGSGEHALTWPAEDGRWTIVVMNEDGGAGVAADLSIGAEVEPLLWIAIGLLVAGVLLALGAAGLVVAGVPRGEER